MTPCTVPAHRSNARPSEKAFVVPGTMGELRDNEWERVLFTDETRFSLSSDSPHTHLERGHNHIPRNIIGVQSSFEPVIGLLLCASLQGERYVVCSFRKWQTLGSSYLTLARSGSFSWIMPLQDEWAAMPQQLIDTLSFSAWADAVKPAQQSEIISPTKDRMFC
ncbi:hypothetical protein TNCV_2938451 [Trichonephila clavipes]|nr:hypothetical protein TNCV_2938451 [Trichonephila clavipes]